MRVRVAPVVVLVAGLAGMLAWPDAARAAEPEPMSVPMSPRGKFDVEARTGLGTPVGLLGLVGEYSPSDAATFGVGAGVNEWGWVGGAVARFRVLQAPPRPRHHGALTLEVSLSAGRYGHVLGLDDALDSLCEGEEDDPTDPCYRAQVLPAVVVWAQVELGWEIRFRSGLILRPSLGIARAINSPDWQCRADGVSAPCVGSAQSPADSTLPGLAIPVLSLALGYDLSAE